MAASSNFNFDQVCYRYKQLCGNLRASLKALLNDAVRKAAASPDDAQLAQEATRLKSLLNELNKDIKFYEKQLEVTISVQNDKGIEIQFGDVTEKLMTAFGEVARGDPQWRSPAPMPVAAQMNVPPQRGRVQQAIDIFEEPSQRTGLPQRRLSFGGGAAAPSGIRPPRQSLGAQPQPMQYTGAVSRRTPQRQQPQQQQPPRASGIPRLSMGASGAQPSRIQPPRSSLGAQPHPMQHTGAIPRRTMQQPQQPQAPGIPRQSMGAFGAQPSRIQPPRLSLGAQPQQESSRVSLGTVAANSLADFNRVVGLVKVMMMQELGFEVPIENVPITNEREAMNMLSNTQFRQARNPRLLERHVRMLLQAAHAAKLLKSSAIAQQVLQELANLRQALASNEPLPPVKMPLSNVEVGTRAFRQLLGAALSINNTIQAACAEQQGEHKACATCKERTARLRDRINMLEDLATNDASARDKNIGFMTAIRDLNGTDLRCDPIEGIRNPDLDDRIRDLNERLPSVLVHLANIVRTDEKTPHRRPKTPEAKRPAGQIPQTAQDLCLARFRRLYREVQSMNAELLRACAEDATCRANCVERSQRLNAFVAQQEEDIKRVLAENNKAQINRLLMYALEELNEPIHRCDAAEGMPSAMMRRDAQDLTVRIQNALQEQKNQVRIDQQTQKRTVAAESPMVQARTATPLTSFEEAIRHFRKLCNDALNNNEAVIEGCGTDPALQDARTECIERNNALKQFINRMKTAVQDGLAAGGPAGVNVILLNALVDLNRIDQKLRCDMPKGMRDPQLRNRIATLADDVQRAIQVQRNHVRIDQAARPAAVEPEAAPRPAGLRPPSSQDDSMQQFRRYSGEALRINEALLAADVFQSGCNDRHRRLQQFVTDVTASVQTSIAANDKPAVNRTLLNALLKLNEPATLRCDPVVGMRNPALQERINALTANVQRAVQHLRNLVHIDEQAQAQRPAAATVEQPSARPWTAQEQAQWREQQERVQQTIRQQEELGRQRRLGTQPMMARGDEQVSRAPVGPEELQRRREREERVAQTIRETEQRGRQRLEAMQEPATGPRTVGAPFPLTQEQHQQSVQRRQQVKQQIQQFEERGQAKKVGRTGDLLQVPAATPRVYTAEEMQQWVEQQGRVQRTIREQEELGRQRRLGTNVVAAQPAADAAAVASRQWTAEDRERVQAGIRQHEERLKGIGDFRSMAAERAPMTEAERQQWEERQQRARDDIAERAAVGHRRRLGLPIVPEENEAPPTTPEREAAQALRAEQRRKAQEDIDRVAEERRRREAGPVVAPRERTHEEKLKWAEMQEKARDVIRRQAQTGDRRRRGPDVDFGDWGYARAPPTEEQLQMARAAEEERNRMEFERRAEAKNREQNDRIEATRRLQVFKVNRLVQPVMADGAEDWQFRVDERPNPFVEVREERRTIEMVKMERVSVPSPRNSRGASGGA